MNENEIFAKEPEVVTESGKKPTHVASLVLGILSIVFALLIAIVGDILGIIGIALACGKAKNTHNVKPGKICSIIGLVLAIANHLLYVLLMTL